MQALQPVTGDPLGTNLVHKSQPLTEKQAEKLIPIFSPMPLIRYPFFASSAKSPRKREARFEENLRDGSKIKWEVESRDYLPGEMELKVWCWLLHKISDVPKPLPLDAYIPYTLREIASYWNLPGSGRVLSLIAKAIKNLQTTHIRHWAQLAGQPAQDMSYSLLADRIGKGDKLDEEVLDKNIIRLGTTLIQLLNSTTKPIDSQTYKALADENLVAARMYDLISWKFYFIRSNGGSCVSFMYSDLTQRIGIKQEKERARARTQLTRAHKYLQKEDLITAEPVWQKIKKDWKIIYTPAEKLKKELAEWEKRKNLKGVAKQIEYADPEMDYALDDIAAFLGAGEEKTFIGLVKKIFKKHENGFDMVFRAISETKAEMASGEIRNKAAYLTSILKKYAE